MRTPTLSAGLDDLGAEDPLGLMLVVAATQHANAVVRRLPPDGDRRDVVELEEPALGAAPAVLADERALLAIARMRRSGRRQGRGADRFPSSAAARLPRRLLTGTFGRREALTLEILEQGVERAVEDVGEISRRNAMAQERLARTSLSWVA